MVKKSIFYIFLFVLAVVLFFNPNFKTITAGIAVLLFGMIMLEEGFKVYAKLLVLRNRAKEGKHLTNKSINTLIAKNLITADMASSLVNDKDNLNEIIKNLISVAELLYGEKDSLLENGKEKKKKNLDMTVA